MRRHLWIIVLIVGAFVEGIAAELLQVKSPSWGLVIGEDIRIFLPAHTTHFYLYLIGYIVGQIVQSVRKW